MTNAVVALCGHDASAMAKEALGLKKKLLSSQMVLSHTS